MSQQIDTKITAIVIDQSRKIIFVLPATKFRIF